MGGPVTPGRKEMGLPEGFPATPLQVHGGKPPAEIAAQRRRALGDFRRRGVRRADQRGEDSGFGRNDTVGRLAEDSQRGGRDPFQFPPEGDQVQVRLEDFTLLPFPLQLPCQAHLFELLPEGAPRRPGDRSGEEEGDQLHRDGTGAAPRPRTCAPGRGGKHRAPVDPPMHVKTAVFGLDDGLQQRRRHHRERGPFGPAPLVGEADPIELHAVAVEQDPFARHVAGAHLLRAREVRADVPAGAGDQNGSQSRQAEEQAGRQNLPGAARDDTLHAGPLPSAQGSTVIAPFGLSPSIPGA